MTEKIDKAFIEGVGAGLRGWSFTPRDPIEVVRELKGLGWASPLATEQTPCPHVDAWDVYDPVETPDTVRVWLAFGATVALCAAVGLTIGVAVAATVGKKVWDTLTGPT